MSVSKAEKVLEMQKLAEISRASKSDGLTVTHLTVRQSLSILLFKLVIIEIVVAALFLGSEYLFKLVGLENALSATWQSFSNWAFIIAIIFEIFLTIYVTLEWVNEYYEITPDEIVHKKGIIFRHEHRQVIEHLAELYVDQGIIGRIFNFGNIKVYNWAKDKWFNLYSIHNPLKYQSVLMRMLPEVDRDRRTLREHVFFKEKEM